MRRLWITALLAPMVALAVPAVALAAPSVPVGQSAPYGAGRTTLRTGAQGLSVRRCSTDWPR